MIKQLTMSALVIGCCASVIGAAVLASGMSGEPRQRRGGTGGTPGFSGDWAIDTSKSDPVQTWGRGGTGGTPGIGPTQVIKVDPTTREITINSDTQSVKYKWDGSETVNVATTGGRTRSKARLVGPSLLIDTTTEDGSASFHETRTLSPDGKEMSVQIKAETAQGTVDHKLVYRKQ
jgi:hypothetical protein